MPETPATPAASDRPRLLGDIGGTNARFAWQAKRGGEIRAFASYPCVQFESLEAVMRHYLSEQGLGAAWQAAIGIANPVLGDWVQMTNHTWHFSIEALRQALGLQRLKVLNDFAALAYALPVLRTDELLQVGGGAGLVGGPLAVLGPGTGLGVAGLMTDSHGNEVVLSGEGGHVTLTAADDEEAAVLAWLRREFSHVSAERVLSGPGLENLYRARCGVQQRQLATLPASEIVRQALEGSDPESVATLDQFLSLLGNFAGNVALTLGATGGVYIGGGIVPRLGARIARSRFRERFEAKGRFSGYLGRIPVQVIDSAAAPALRGAARSLDSP
jgi:glucokinase